MFVGEDQEFKAGFTEEAILNVAKQEDMIVKVKEPGQEE